MIHAHTATLRTPRQLTLHVVDTDDVINDEHQGELARVFARRFREELDWIEAQDNCAFALLRHHRTPLEQLASEA